MTFILASKSASRQKLLKNAGLMFEVLPANIDENLIKREMLKSGSSVLDIAERLACEKALKISQESPDQYIIGGDQMLTCGDQLFNKARTVLEAKEHLKFFKGKVHTLTTSLAIAKDNKIIWAYTSEPKLTMRDFSDEFLEDYMSNAGGALLHSVGCYYLEENGIQLFSEIKGDYYDILGLPLLPLLKKLRDLNLINE
ncbi:MAG: Maf family nucleotide pyrophosphatase [Emcibacteraceae bacterium]|nr:Maf family nucleotide pyrophosphatase [Emcibacteraceae bacterium]